MLLNATLLRIDVSAGSTPGGVLLWTLGGPLSIRCSIQEDAAADAQPNDSQLTEGRSLVLRTLLSDYLAATPITLAAEMRVSIVADGDSSGPATYRVRSVSQRPKGSLSFIEARLRVD